VIATPNEGQLSVAGASLFYRVRGAGPLLLVLPGGHCDADAADAMCDRLVDRFTVVTYDRRGQSRSPIDAAADTLTIETHSDDAHALLAALTSAPALVFGSSFGALIGLDLATRYSSSVRLFVAHEPPAWDLLPEAGRDRARHGLDELVRAFHEQGVLAAFQKLADLTATDLTDREEGVGLQLPTPRVAANLKFFFTYDAPAVNRYRLDFDALSRAAARIVPAAGRAKKEAAPRRCAVALAELLHAPLAELPGGHSGWLLRPKEFATKLAELVSE
jgi:pimeloyl-ACP methyl ester carboxylesterase